MYKIICGNISILNCIYLYAFYAPNINHVRKEKLRKLFCNNLVPKYNGYKYILNISFQLELCHFSETAV